MWKKKKIFDKLLAEKVSEFVGIKDKMNSNESIYNFSTEGKIPKIFWMLSNVIRILQQFKVWSLNPKWSIERSSKTLNQT